MSTALLPAVGQQTALERKYSNAILKLNPGIGEKSLAIASTLTESGLPSAIVSTLINAIYSPADPLGRGQGTRIKWLTETLQRRWANRLDAIRGDPKRFKAFIGEIEDVVDMRDTLNGEDFTISYEHAFLLWELGFNAEAFCGLVAQIEDRFSYYSRKSAARQIVRAAILTKAGHFYDVATAIDSMTHDFRNSPTDD